MDGPLRILIADDHALVRTAIVCALQMERAWTIVGQAGDGAQAVELAGLLEPDVVLIDVAMPRLNGIEATRAIITAVPFVRVIGVSMHSEPETVALMRRAGAVEFIGKTEPLSALLEAIRRAA